MKAGVSDLPYKDMNAACVLTAEAEQHQEQDGQLTTGLRICINSSFPVKLEYRWGTYHHTHTVREMSL